jgi:hypothetical protein
MTANCSTRRLYRALTCFPCAEFWLTCAQASEQAATDATRAQEEQAAAAAQLAAQLVESESQLLLEQKRADTRLQSLHNSKVRLGLAADAEEQQVRRDMCSVRQAGRRRKKSEGVQSIDECVYASMR